MAIYDINGNRIDERSGSTSSEIFLSSSKTIHLKEQSDFDMSEFDIIRTFTPFETDYATESGTPRVLDVSQQTFYNTFYEPYLGYHDDLLVTKKKLGKDQSETYDIWCYDFIPYNAKKKILLSSGMHTYELPASFGLARWIKEFMESEDEVFAYMRQNVYISVIPIVNPWGFNHNPKTYGNMNGINPARNFNDWDDSWGSFPSYTPQENEWNVKGDAPFSEAEVKIMSEWMKNNTDASFHIDCHTGLGCSKSLYGDVWTISLSANPLRSKITAAQSEIMSHIQTTYSVTPKKRDAVDTTDVINQKYFVKVVGVPSMTIEQPQYSDTSYTTVPNNNKTAIKEYATMIHAYIVAQLQ